MKAVVMAGGFGTRIQPLTNSVPKPMLPIMNRPMMEHIMLRLRDIGIKEFVVLLYFKPEVVKEHFGDGSKFGINITYVLPDDDYGTAGAVKQAQKHLNEPFIIISGDLVTDFDIDKILRFHKEKRSKLSITLTSVPDPLQFGVVITDKSDKIQRFLEKPSWGEVFSDTINTGIYVIEPEILDYIPENTNFDFSKDLFPKLMAEGVDLWGCNAKGYWRDVGNPESYREVMQDIFRGDVKVDFPGTRKEFENGTVYIGRNSSIADDAVIEGTVVLGDNVKVGSGARLKDVVIGNNTKVEGEAEASNCAIWHGVVLSEDAKVNNCVICNSNTLGKNVSIEKGVILAENCEIGDNATFEKDVIVWPNKIVEPAAIITNNIIWGDKYKKSIFEGGMVRGRTNIELSCEMSTKLAEAIGSTLPVGSKIYVSRDYHKASRMLKRSFMGGLMSAGINIGNLHFIPSSLLRFMVGSRDEAAAGVHFRQSTSNMMETEILFYDQDGLVINTNTEKSTERIFFREKFRRVSNEEIGDIFEVEAVNSSYTASFLEKTDGEALRSSAKKVAVDLLYGSTSTIYPEIVNALNIENVMLNAYFDDKKLSKLPENIQTSRTNIARIIRGLELDVGILLYPNGQKMEVVCQEGKLLTGTQTLLVMLYLLNETATELLNVYLPVSAPDVLDEAFTNLRITRGKSGSLDKPTVTTYDFVGTLNGMYAFTHFSHNYDAMFASIKLISMLSRAKTSMREVLAAIPNFYFQHEKVPCTIAQKGLMMRKFTEEAMGKEASFDDGVKIFFDDGAKVTMIPDQHAENLHLYIQAPDEERGESLLTDFAAKIGEWKKEG